MGLLKYTSIIVPIIFAWVFTYYRTLVFVGEFVRIGWLRGTLVIVVFLAFISALFFIGIFALYLAPPSGFTLPLIVALVAFVGSALVVYKKYKPRLDAVGIKFR